MKLTYCSKIRHTDEVYSFTFSSQEPIAWLPGQSIRLELPGLYGSEERRFTISSAPYQAYIEVTTVISDSSYKQTLSALAIGQEVNAYAIDGKFTWPDSPESVVLCANGIGITPYMSMIRQRAHDKNPINATLLYFSNNKTFVFNNQLRMIQADHPELNLVFLSNQRMSAAAIDKNSKDILHKDIYLCGSSSLVNEVAAQLITLGVSAEGIKRDWFTGKDV